MIDFQKLWEEGRAGAIHTPELKESDLQKLKERSDSPLKNLKRNILINSGFASVFLIGFIALFIIVDGFWFRFFMAIVSFFYLASIFFNRWVSQKYLQELPHDESILIRLKSIYTGMNKAFRAQELTSIFIYPIAMTAGFLLPLTLNGELDLFNEGYALWIILFILFIILTPLCYWLGKYLNKLAFGKYIKQIGAIVDEMEQTSETSV